MNDNNEWNDLIGELKVFSIWIVSSLIDVGFLALWVSVQWIVNENVIKTFTFSGIDRWILLAFQVIFALSTLAPIVVYIYVDIRVMLLGAQRRIGQEIALSKAKTQVVNTSEKLPLEHPLRKMLRIYAKRLTVFFAVIALNFVLLVHFGKMSYWLT